MMVIQILQGVSVSCLLLIAGQMFIYEDAGWYWWTSAGVCLLTVGVLEAVKRRTSRPTRTETSTTSTSGVESSTSGVESSTSHYWWHDLAPDPKSPEPGTEMLSNRPPEAVHHVVRRHVRRHVQPDLSHRTTPDDLHARRREFLDELRWVRLLMQAGRVHLEIIRRELELLDREEERYTKP